MGNKVTALLSRYIFERIAIARPIVRTAIARPIVAERSPAIFELKVSPSPADIPLRFLLIVAPVTRWSYGPPDGPPARPGDKSWMKG